MHIININCPENIYMPVNHNPCNYGSAWCNYICDTT
ncbi:hypothetical protein LOK49_LG01G02897 [Camellia lanceoleosa]|uniref:Uncharacterized protein n=1 Tax=Camellia lanceoleosa TaxID=1840588 RepID=A0ACC0IWI1_9ERIC|nr:hypothetical protein LOK49_LG01G02897 [Camellia lanceoleosa]